MYTRQDVITATEETSVDLQERGSVGKEKQRLFNISNIIGIILCILLLPGFLISTTLLVSSLIHRDVPPSCFGYTPLMVETGSMKPLFDESDLVLVKNGGSSFDVGDIICFRSGRVYVTHRINEITKDEDGNTVYITKGDANNTPDKDPVYADQILGAYKTHFDGMGKALMFIQTPVGMVVCVMLPIFLMIFLFTVPARNPGNKKRKNQAMDDHNFQNRSNGENMVTAFDGQN